MEISSNLLDLLTSRPYIISGDALKNRFFKVLASIALAAGIYLHPLKNSEGNINSISQQPSISQQENPEELYLAFAFEGKDSAEVFRIANIEIVTDYNNLEASVVNATKEKLDELVNSGDLEFYVRRNGSLENVRTSPSYIRVIEDDTEKPTTLSNEWAHNRVRATALRRNNVTGQGIKIGIFDTGIDSAVPEFSGMVAGFHDHVYNHGDTIEQAYDDYGHGTFVASIIQRILPECKFYVYKIHQQSGENNISDVFEAFDVAYSDHLDVINNSWGLDYPTELDGMTFEDANKALEEVIERISATGTIVVASAGNDSSITLKSLQHLPDGSPFAISVGATNILDEVADFSDLDGEIFAPGETVYGTRRNNIHTFWDGTSFSGPFVAGAVGAAIEYSREHNREYSFESIKNALIKSGERQSSIIVTPNRRFTYRFKFLNLNRLLEYIRRH